MANRKSTATPRLSSEDRTWLNFTHQPAQIEESLVDKIERDMRTAAPWSAWRRIALMSLTKSGAELIDAMKGDHNIAESFANVAVNAKEYAGQLRALADMMDTASVRLYVALCGRPDVEKIIASAQRKAA